MKFTFSLLGSTVAFILGITSLQSCTKSDNTTPAPTATLLARQDSKLGALLTDGEGNTLYFSAKDVSGTSACSGGCTDVWPVFHPDKKIIGAGIDSTKVSTITRADGKSQTTYRGWPLYRFRDDAKPGATNGEGKNGFYVAKPDYTLFLADQGQGKYLVDAVGRSLYVSANDTDDISNCKDGCSKVWPTFFVQPVVAPSTLATYAAGIISRTDGTKQVTFNKKPLYFFSNDAVRGDAKGNAANPKFSLFTPAL